MLHIRNYVVLWFSPLSVKSVLIFSLPQRVLQVCWLSKPGNSLRFAHRTGSGGSSCAGGAASVSLVVSFWDRSATPVRSGNEKYRWILKFPSLSMFCDAPI